MTILVDTTPAIESLRAAISALFRIAPERVEIRTTAKTRGTTAVLVVEVLIDGQPAGDDVRAFVDDLIGAATQLAALSRSAARAATPTPNPND